MTTSVRSAKQIAYARKAFEEAKKNLVDEGGSLLAAGKKVSRDSEKTKGPNFTWILGDMSNGSSERRHLAAQEDHVEDLLHPGHEAALQIKTSPRQPPPFAVGGLWDLENSDSVSRPPEEDSETDDDEDEAPAASPEDEPFSHDEPPLTQEADDFLPALSKDDAEEKDETKEMPAVVTEKKKKKKKKKMLSAQASAGPKRRFLVINQPASCSSYSPVTRKFSFDAKTPPPPPKQPVPIVTRHFPKSPIIENERYPPARPDYHTEYDKYAWPNPRLRLR